MSDSSTSRPRTGTDEVSYAIGKIDQWTGSLITALLTDASQALTWQEQITTKLELMSLRHGANADLIIQRCVASNIASLPRPQLDALLQRLAGEQSADLPLVPLIRTLAREEPRRRDDAAAAYRQHVLRAAREVGAARLSDAIEALQAARACETVETDPSAMASALAPLLSDEELVQLLVAIDGPIGQYSDFRRLQGAMQEAWPQLMDEYPSLAADVRSTVDDCVSLRKAAAAALEARGRTVPAEPQGHATLAAANESVRRIFGARFGIQIGKDRELTVIRGLASTSAQTRAAAEFDLQMKQLGRQKSSQCLSKKPAWVADFFWGDSLISTHRIRDERGELVALVPASESANSPDGEPADKRPSLDDKRMGAANGLKRFSGTLIGPLMRAVEAAPNTVQNLLSTTDSPITLPDGTMGALLGANEARRTYIYEPDERGGVLVNFSYEMTGAPNLLAARGQRLIPLRKGDATVTGQISVRADRATFGNIAVISDVQPSTRTVPYPPLTTREDIFGGRAHPNAYADVREFAQRFHADENFKFLDGLHDVLGTPGSVPDKAAVQKFFDDYVSEAAPKQTNISDSGRKAIRDLLDNWDTAPDKRAPFDIARYDVQQGIAGDLRNRFEAAVDSGTFTPTRR